MGPDVDQDRLPTPAPEEAAAHDAAAPHPAIGQSRLVRAPLFFAGVLLPVVSFLLVNLNLPGPRLGGLSGHLLMYPASAALSPLLLYSMISMGLVVFQPGQCGNNNFVRFGIFSGVLIAAEYCAILHSAFWHGPGALAYEAVFLAVSAVGVLVPMGILWLDIRMARKFGLAYISLTLASIVGVLVVLTGETALIAVAVPCLGFSTAWAFAAYGFVSIRLIGAAPPPRFRYSLAQLLAVTTWFAAHCAAWRCAFLWVLHQYQQVFGP
ncbi:MAG: hypothetical protein ACLQLG_11590 [Thermoguttaceae bacterium]